MTEDVYRQVFIRNIPYDITDDDLSDWCTSFGPITRCILKRDKLGNSRGFAFVTFASIDGHNKICKNKFFTDSYRKSLEN
jgi:RNA recognition motif-containing protein